MLRITIIEQLQITTYTKYCTLVVYTNTPILLWNYQILLRSHIHQTIVFILTKNDNIHAQCKNQVFLKTILIEYIFLHKKVLNLK